MTPIGSQPGSLGSAPGCLEPGAYGLAVAFANPLAGTALYIRDPGPGYALHTSEMVLPIPGFATHNSEALVMGQAIYGVAVYGNYVYGTPNPLAGAAVHN